MYKSCKIDFLNYVTVHSVHSNVAKIHSRLPAAMEFWLVCLGIGGLLKVCPVVSTDGLNKALFKSLPERHHNLIPLNMKAVEEGMKIIEKVER